MSRIALLIPYFGTFPEWSELYFETLRANPSIDFIFFTNVRDHGYRGDNLHFEELNFEDYVQLANQRLNIRFKPGSPYKLCDLRPFYGALHQSELSAYDFYGWCDMDILFGDIRSFYTEDLLASYDVFSTHEVRISGHMAPLSQQPPQPQHVSPYLRLGK